MELRFKNFRIFPVCLLAAMVLDLTAMVFQLPAVASEAGETRTTLVEQAAEQNKDIVIQSIESLLMEHTLRQDQETYYRMHTFGGADIIDALYANLGLLVMKWLKESYFLPFKILAVALLAKEFLHARSRRARSSLMIALKTIPAMILLGVLTGIP